jgi:3-mercaptopyruvate sulfurtransferase SseA
MQNMKAMARPALVVSLVLVAASVACAGGGAGSSSGWPWGNDSVTPADFAKELAAAPDADKPVIVCTAPPFLYRTAHIPGAVLHGPASSPGGLNSLTKWADALPRNANVVIYCGCCPLAACPNLAPAYKALKGMGFARVRVLLLEENFKASWIDRGYPYER